MEFSAGRIANKTWESLRFRWTLKCKVCLRKLVFGGVAGHTSFYDQIPNRTWTFYSEKFYTVSFVGKFGLFTVKPLQRLNVCIYLVLSQFLLIFIDQSVCQYAYRNMQQTNLNVYYQRPFHMFYNFFL